MQKEITRRLAMAGIAALPVATAAKTGGTDRLRVGDRLPRFDLLRPGAKTYLISAIKGDRHIATNVWRREIRFENGKLRIVQHWDGVGPDAPFVDRDSLFEMGTFRPSSHTRISEKAGQRMVEGFLFRDRDIVGLPGLAGNIRGDFSVASDEPMFNFETDMEMLGTLPWAPGYKVSIPFFHPAPGSVPARYLWICLGDEALPGPDGRPLDCWIVGCDYNKGGAPTRFWFAKRTQQFVKLEGAGPDGTIHRKTLLWP